MSTEYQPGVCNIGPAEIRARRLIGYIGLAATVAALVLFVIFQVPALYRVLVAIPAGLAANGFLQAAMHFCVGFAMRGLYDMGDTLATPESVMEKEFRRADQKKGLQITGYSVLIAAAVVLIAVLLP